MWVVEKESFGRGRSKGWGSGVEVVEGGRESLRWRKLTDGGVTSDVEGVGGASSKRGRIRPVDLSVIENE